MAYDDVAFGRPAGPDDDGGRDRLGVHLGWEIVLLLGAAALGFLLYRFDPASLRRPALDTLLITATAIGLLTLGAGLTLRAGVPNLAVGPIALAASLHFAENGDRGLLKAALPALVIAAGGAVVIAVLILALHVPGWVATLGAGIGVIVYDQLRTAPVAVQGGYDPSNQAFFLFGGFALLAVVGGAVGVLDSVRRKLGAMRQPTDPARRRTGVALPVLASLIASSVFAVAAGILLAAQSARPIVPGTGLEWTGIALGTALVAGTSAFGRRGGVFGTLLAVVAMTLFLDYAGRRGFDIALFATAACTIGGGLIVTRLIETYGRTLTVADAEPDWQPDPPAETAAWRADLPETWSSSGVGAQRRGERWDDGPWGSGR
ncbi:monosaccharide ABC transporter membrane protein (CUT2 family) [Krasilnikovia cinnamomea]|uniref:Monosaccharide ABC transporter membrane protein (CUT2 family) n=1 Tax=Krasilnikovia cinnamomea TaxID=349313 RepID=A0A4Q7ZIF6_9ACTN|nr:ABC transporter permease [Krasilnikovia cinnamomea]RZU50627.1 monosaccharide ABC transporter membrane protein (CUT2 family) [Krasilnikovia cinnamomea]